MITNWGQGHNNFTPIEDRDTTRLCVPFLDWNKLFVSLSSIGVKKTCLFQGLVKCIWDLVQWDVQNRAIRRTSKHRLRRRFCMRARYVLVLNNGAS